MKIAVCFSGQFRTAKECAPNLKAFFSSDTHEIDFFIHTWDTTSYKNFNGTNIYPQRDRILTQEEIDFLKSTYNPKLLKVESHSEYLKKYTNKGFGSGLELWYSFYKSISLKKLHERKNNFKYDFVIKVRLDCMFRKVNQFDEHINHILKYPSNYIVTHFRYDTNWKSKLNQISANDIFFIGTSKTIDSYSSFFIDKRIYDKKTNPSYCKNDGYGYTQFMHTFFKKIEAVQAYDEPFVLREAYKELASLDLNRLETHEKIELMDGYYYSYYKNDINANYYVYSLFDENTINFDDYENKIYLNEIE
jgi:hypothetical protein